MAEVSERSTPGFFDFDPRHIPFQTDVVLDIEDGFDYSIGAHDILLSGSVGSAKSLLMAHCAVKHCLLFPNAKIIMGRISLPDIKRTIFSTICEHLSATEGIQEGVDWFQRETTADIWFSNGSEILPVYWNDKKWKRIMSINASAAIIEELTENDDTYKKGFFSIKQRIGRLPHVPHKWLMCATNPDSPRHWAYKYFIEPITQGSQSQTRHVYYSKTEQNPFLPPEYIRQLREDLDPKEAMRQLEGQWIEIDVERIYHSYSSDKNFINKDYEVNNAHPITINFDFNIGQGKPMSAAAYQRIGDEFHIFSECVVHGARTIDILDEWEGKGLFQHQVPFFIIHGDATGSHRDTRNIQSDYDLIVKWLSNKNIKHRLEVPRDNPAVRNRHNRVNAYCLNDLGQIRLFVYKSCPVTDEGFRLTALKKGGEYIEDDSKHYQHITTAIGYGIVYDTNMSKTTISSQKVR